MDTTEPRGTAISFNLHPAGFDELMPKTLVTATVDRLLHHAHVCQTSGDSVRLTQALAGVESSDRTNQTKRWPTPPKPQWADLLAITGQFYWPPAGTLLATRG